MRQRTQVQALLRSQLSKPTNTIPPKLQAWVNARNRHRLSHAQVQMARELGLNPTKLGSLDNHRQEPWKAPLPEHIKRLYLKRFGRNRPEVIVSIEQQAKQLQDRAADRKTARRIETATAADASRPPPGTTPSQP
ncbi:MAG: hypothetical protein ABSG43_27945 [Solirubrobacteraceae bacterium]